MSCVTVYIIRHGETDMNREERLQGQIDSQLNETGINEARNTAALFRKAGVIFDKVYSSPLKRAMRTAEIISGGAAVAAEPLIMEMRFGHYEGMKYDTIDGEMWRFIHDPENVVPPEGVESIKSLTDRTGDFLRKLLSDSISGNIAVVTHGIALRSMLWNIYSEADRKRVWSMPIENCVVYRLEVRDGVFSGIQKDDKLSLRIDNDTSSVF